MYEHIHTIELFYHAKNSVTLFNAEYDAELMVAIINDLQRLIWTIGDHESDTDNIPWILLDDHEIDCELEDINRDDLCDKLNKIYGADDE